MWFSAVDIHASYPSVKFLFEVGPGFDQNSGQSAWLPHDFPTTALACIQLSASYSILTPITDSVLIPLHCLTFFPSSSRKCVNLERELCMCKTRKLLPSSYSSFTHKHCRVQWDDICRIINTGAMYIKPKQYDQYCKCIVQVTDTSLTMEKAKQYTVNTLIRSRIEKSEVILKITRKCKPS